MSRLADVEVVDTLGPYTFDLRSYSGRGDALRWVAMMMKPTEHGRGGVFHRVRLDPQALRLVVGPHRHGGAAVRLDGFCLNCPGDGGWKWAPTFVHQEEILPYVDGAYKGSAAIGSLPPNGKRFLPDGTRWVDAEGLRLVCLALSRSA